MCHIAFIVTMLLLGILAVWALSGNGGLRVMEFKPIWYCVVSILLGLNLVVFHGIIPLIKRFFS